MNLETFQLLDAIAIRPGETAADAWTTVPETSSILAHHFPGHPLLPGVFQVETAAQTAGFLALSLCGWERMPLLSCVDKARFRLGVRPGDTLHAQTRITRNGSAYCAARTILDTRHGTAADIDLRLRFMPFPSDEMRAALHETFLGIAASEPDGTAPGRKETA